MDYHLHNYLIFLIITIFSFAETKNAPEVTIPQGTVVGLVSTGVENFEYYSYRNIPYAKPPVGNLRFKAPLPPEPWDGILDGTKSTITCAQFDPIFLGAHTGDEDCLILNIHIPKEALSSSEPLAVMVWIHGGIFTGGSSSEDLYGPQYLVKKGIVFVSTNYRIGPLGYLSLDIPEVPGNAGIKDLVMALRWINQNIKHFGGDPNRVTIFGGDAGSAAVEYLLASLMAKGLFHGAIAQSGSILTEAATQVDTVENVQRLLRAMNIDEKDPNAILEILLKADVKDICKAIPIDFNKNKLDIPFVPSVEKSFPGVESLITKRPFEIFKAGEHLRVPTIIGFNSNEGAVVVMVRLRAGNKEFTTVEDFIPDFNTILPLDILEKINHDPQRVNQIIDEVRSMYFDREGHIYKRFGYTMADIMFMDGIYHMIEVMSAYPDVYCYRFDYNGERNPLKMLIPMEYEGATHFDEYGYLFSMMLVEDGQTNDKDRNVMENYLNLWTNFAKHGKSGLEHNWTPVNKQNLGCLNLAENFQMLDNPYPKTLDYWYNLRKELNVYF